MLIALLSDPFNPAERLGAFEASLTERGLDAGAVVSFTGKVRAENGDVKALVLEAYPGFSETVIADYCARVAEERRILDVVALHRTGRVEPGDAIVFVAVAACHRREAFLAADQIMDFLKTSAPFWKKSVDADGERWIEPREQDYHDQARWDPARPPVNERG